MKSLSITGACLLFFVFLLGPFGAFAAEFQIGADVNLPEDRERIIEDFYTAGGTITISHPINGDLMVAGGEVAVGSMISDDLMVAGGEVLFSGNVADDVRIAGGEITITGEVADDLLVSGGTILVDEDAIVQGSTYLAGGEVLIKGTFMGDVEINAEQVMVDAVINGNLKVRSTDFGISLDSDISGDLDYTSVEEISDRQEDRVAGSITFSPFPDRTLVFGLVTVGAFITLLSLICAAIVMILIMRRASERLVHTVTSSFLNSFWKGALIFFLGPAVVLLLLATVVGWQLGVASLALYGAFILIAWIYTGIVIGSFTFSYLRREKEVKVTVLRAVLGVFLSWIIAFIPIVGLLVLVIVFIATLGAIGKNITNVLWKKSDT